MENCRKYRRKWEKWQDQPGAQARIWLLSWGKPYDLLLSHFRIVPFAFDIVWCQHTADLQ